MEVRRTETRYKDSSGRYMYDIKEFPKTKAGVRTVVVPKQYEWVLERLLAVSTEKPYVFMANGKRLNTERIRKHLYRLCTKLNIYKKSPHKIRKTYGTILLDYNIDDRLVIDQMGHTNIGMSERHYHRNRKSLDKKSQIISAIPDFNRKTAP